MICPLPAALSVVATMNAKGSSTAPKGATAFGVRLLDTWIADNYG